MAVLPELGGGFIDNSLPYLLTVAALAASNSFDETLRLRGVSVPVWRVLAVLLERPGTKVTDLAQRCLLQQPTMTKLLDRMARDQLVQRTFSNRDQRVVHVTLTPAGMTLATALVEAAKQHEAALLARHPQIEAIRDGLRAIITEHRSGGEGTG
jgi:DNA-binding MarR family transcriptional regulator